MKTKALVLLSGGLDSAVALYWALHRGFEVESLTFNYFRRSSKEIKACNEIAKKVGCKNRLVKLDFLKEIEDTKTRLRNKLLNEAPSAYIPSRNMIFYGIAASFAEILDARYIIGGHNKDDAVHFPDSSSAFFSLFNKTASLGRISGSRTGKVMLPLAKLDKAGVVKFGMKLGVPFANTWSCYKSSTRPCGNCHSCLLRKEAFRLAGIEDPLIMAHP